MGYLAAPGVSTIREDWRRTYWAHDCSFPDKLSFVNCLSCARWQGRVSVLTRLSPTGPTEQKLGGTSVSSLCILLKPGPEELGPDQGRMPKSAWNATLWGPYSRSRDSSLGQRKVSISDASSTYFGEGLLDDQRTSRDGDASLRNLTNSESSKGSLMTETMDIFARLSPDSIDHARDLVVNIEDMASISAALTLEYTLVVAKTRLKDSSCSDACPGS